MRLLPAMGLGEWVELIVCAWVLVSCLVLVVLACAPRVRVRPRKPGEQVFGDDWDGSLWPAPRPTTPQQPAVPRQRGRHR